MLSNFRVQRLNVIGLLELSMSGYQRSEENERTFHVFHRHGMVACTFWQYLVTFVWKWQYSFLYYVFIWLPFGKQSKWKKVTDIRQEILVAQIWSVLWGQSHIFNLIVCMTAYCGWVDMYMATGVLWHTLGHQRRTSSCWPFPSVDAVCSCVYHAFLW